MKATDYNISNYNEICNCLLTSVSVPRCHMDCVKDVCNEHCHYIELNNYYTDIIKCMTDAADKCIPS